MIYEFLKGGKVSNVMGGLDGFLIFFFGFLGVQSNIIGNL